MRLTGISQAIHSATWLYIITSSANDGLRWDRRSRRTEVSDQLVEGRLSDRVMAKGATRRGESRHTILTDWGVMRARRLGEEMRRCLASRSDLPTEISKLHFEI